MRTWMITAAAAAGLVLAACGQEKAPEAPAAPQGLFEQAAGKSAADATSMAFGLVRGRAGLDPPCNSVRDIGDKGVVPGNVAPDSVYAPYVGARVFTVQCGELSVNAHLQPTEKWLVVLKPGAMEAEVVSCAGGQGGRADNCYGDIPTAAADAAAGGQGAPASTQ